MENVVTVIFETEAEAYKAFAEIRDVPFGEGYAVAEASLLKREEAEAEKAEKRDARKAKVQAHFDEIKAKRAERKAMAAEAKEIANAQFTSSTKEMLGTE